MKTKDLVLNFVRQFKKPFTAETVSNMIAQDLSVIEPVLLELLADKKIKLISKKEGIYVLADRYSPKVCYSQKGNWKFEIKAATALLDQIEKGKYTSIRAIAKDFGRSRQWVFVYMEALASIGCIGMEGKQYKVISRDRLREIGKHIEPGILGRMRPSISKEEKLRRAEEKELRRQEQLNRAEARELLSATTEQKYRLIDAYFEYLVSGESWKISFKTYLRQNGLE